MTPLTEPMRKALEERVKEILARLEVLRSEDESLRVELFRLMFPPPDAVQRTTEEEES